MAYRRSLTTKAKQFAQQRFSPTSFAYLHHHDEDRKFQDPKMNNSIQSSFIHTSLGFGGCGGGVGAGKFRDRRCSQLGFHPVMMMSGMVSGRYMSTTVGDGAGDIQYMTDMAEVFTEKTVEAVANTAAAAGPVVSEVAVAAADSAPPVAALQYVIEGVHNFTGFEWWACIALTTVLIRTLTIPVLINQLKSTSKLTLIRPKLEAIKDEMQNRGMSPSAVAEGQAEMKKLFEEHGVSTFTPLKGLLISGPIFVSFFFAIQNMVEKVPSFKTGGAFWFTDLTTPDALYIFPVLTAFTFWITAELNMQEGMEGNPAANTMKNFSRGFAALSIPLTMSFPKALFCYWITSNLFSLLYGSVIKQHAVKRFLNIPIIVPPPPDTTSKSKPAFSFWEGLKKYAAAQAHQQKLSASSAKPVGRSTPSPSPSIEPSSSSPTLGKKPGSQKISPTSVLSHRIQSLEKEVKGRKKNKRR